VSGRHVGPTRHRVAKISYPWRHQTATSAAKALNAQSGMAQPRLGELFVSLEPTNEEKRRAGGRYLYQQLVINDLIQNFGLEQEAIVQIPALARFQLNNRNTRIPEGPTSRRMQPGGILPGEILLPYPRIPDGPNNRQTQPGEIRSLDHCFHLGYISDFLIIQGVAESCIVRQSQVKFRTQWQRHSINTDNFIAKITRGQR